MNANDFFYEKDGIDKPKARRNEGGFTHRRADPPERVFFFGGYQRTQAETGFVPTASSITVLPQALQLIQGARTKENVLAAFAALNPGNSEVDSQGAVRRPHRHGLHLGRRDEPPESPQPGHRRLRDRRAAGRRARSSGTTSRRARRSAAIRSSGSGTSCPAEFTQDQYTLKLDGQLTANNRLSATGFYAKFPGLDPFPDPSSLASPFTLKRADRNATVALSDTHVFGHQQGQRAARRHVLSQQLPPAGRSVPRADERGVGVANPATFYDASIATHAPGPLHRPAGRHDGALFVRRAERQLQQAAAADLDDRRHAQLDD